jgi:beta-1,4-mannooligosaccharide/beta-1,4-mannosyl-N-acetylglucosamine phosphorylase
MINYTLPNIPWEDRPSGSREVVWRYSANPIIPRDLLPVSNSIFNSATVPFNDKFTGMFRVDNRKRDMTLHSVVRPTHGPTCGLLRRSGHGHGTSVLQSG